MSLIPRVPKKLEVFKNRFKLQIWYVKKQLCSYAGHEKECGVAGRNDTIKYDLIDLLQKIWHF